MCTENRAGKSLFGEKPSGRRFGNLDSSPSYSSETDCLKMSISSSDVGRVIGKYWLHMAIYLYIADLAQVKVGHVYERWRVPVEHKSR